MVKFYCSRPKSKKQTKQEANITLTHTDKDQQYKGNKRDEQSETHMTIPPWKIAYHERLRSEIETPSNSLLRLAQHETNQTIESTAAFTSKLLFLNTISFKPYLS